MVRVFWCGGCGAWGVWCQWLRGAPWVLAPGPKGFKVMRVFSSVLEVLLDVFPTSVFGTRSPTLALRRSLSTIILIGTINL